MPFILFRAIVYYLRLFIKGLFEPHLSLSEILEKLEPTNLKYIEHKKVSREEFEIFNSIEIEKKPRRSPFIRDSYFKLITYSKTTKKFNLFWIKKTKCTVFNFMGIYFFIGLVIGENLRKIIGTKYIEEKNINKLNEIQTEYNSKIVLINNVCPACVTPIKKNDLTCNKCGLNLSS